ncbi:MAG TPA: aconitase/3-isopropylmalate dehydratase large subunit family protein [Bryobacteraceae bacterium]|jgi:3-isopropylmalate/(R)-2-methylmalate dehydratase large subunit|nr:aconitase/3-isopropylmalate dehydratase large subunit family protein [Bryobacteraceae bacterium]
MNVIEKILAKASGHKEVRPGDVVVANIDLMVMHDLSSNFVMKVFENEMENAKIKDPSRIAFAFDHNFAPATQAAAEALAAVRKFAAKHGIKHVFDCGCGSIHHAVIESGLWKPGQIIIGCDSHTPIYGAIGVFATGVGNNSMAALGFQYSLGWFRVPETIQVVFHGQAGPAVTPRDVSQYFVGKIGEDGAVYKAIEYAGPYMQALSVEDRMLFPLQSIDVGGKCGFVNPDEKTIAFAQSFAHSKDFEMPVNDPGISYKEVIDIDVSKLDPQIACPPTVGNVKSIDEAVGIPVNIAEVGGSTGGRIEDIRLLARCLANRKVHPDVRLQVVPVSRGAYGAALREGLFQILHDAGANIFPPSAGSNQAFNMGAMAEEEVMVSTQARNFPGRNGHPKARHYLGSTLTVAASAITGRITDPRSI